MLQIHLKPAECSFRSPNELNKPFFVVHHLLQIYIKFVTKDKEICKQTAYLFFPIKGPHACYEYLAKEEFNFFHALVHLVIGLPVLMVIMILK